MRRPVSLPQTGYILLMLAAGCAPQLVPPETDVLGVALAPATTSTDENDVTSQENVDHEAAPAAPASFGISGSLVGTGNYEVYELGNATAGSIWSVSGADVFSPPAPMVVVLFDTDYNLLMRSVVTATHPLQHVMRETSPQVYLAVTPPSGGDGGQFHYAVTHTSPSAVPAARQQVVWLNFAATSQVRVHNRSGISFAAFDGAMLGGACTGHTDVIKQTIVEVMREDYADYDVVILTSDDGPPPAGPYSTVHFGGSDPGLLGLADNVDNYNENLTQNAIVFVETFARFDTMGLDAEEMAVMVGNVASHELGHLLGLYHTRDPDDIMDTTGSAWDLADSQAFTRTVLDPTVFPTGWEHSPRLLAQTVGRRSGVAALDLPASTAKIARRAMIRRFAREQISCMCGTCQHLDDH